MSRADKQLRRKHRKQKKQRHSRWAFSEFSTELPGNVVSLLGYDISFDPLEREDERIPGLDEALAPVRVQLFEDAHKNPQAAIPVLKGLLERFPNAPILMNWLAAAMSRARDFEGAVRVVRQNYEANPNYLFARIAYAQCRVQDGDLDAVDQIFEKQFDLKLLYPERKVFHISEFRAFAHLMINYWIRRREFEPARKLFEVLERLEPDGELTQLLRGAVRGSSLLEAAKALSSPSRYFR